MANCKKIISFLNKNIGCTNYLHFIVFQNKQVLLFSLEETLHLEMLNILFLDKSIQVALINLQFYSVSELRAKFLTTFLGGIFLILFLATFLATFPKNLANLFFNLLVTLIALSISKCKKVQYFIMNFLFVATNFSNANNSVLYRPSLLLTVGSLIFFFSS